MIVFVVRIVVIGGVVMIAFVRGLKATNCSQHRSHQITCHKKLLKERQQQHARAEASNVNGAAEATEN